ncbi:nose resistant to fluoxetine protein 6-like [Tropilaelaps mercedesae]|uniref:Nose resistant to fluoxetine protein 6-like n=1 Tax=Tropilaelaps mercedesae TaxID=418985 RepID=A0A1V9X9L0_9ACAR|nr:nose resistant to fluoxetine protein 6-like [Tropilaelaps mercedesae]
MDAMGKPASGLASGTIADLGNYDQCLAVEAPDGDEAVDFTETVLSDIRANARPHSLDIAGRLVDYGHRKGRVAIDGPTCPFQLHIDSHEPWDNPITVYRLGLPNFASQPASRRQF